VRSIRVCFFTNPPFDLRTKDRGRTGGRSSASAQNNFTP
jgi:hypothetical protein